MCESLVSLKINPIRNQFASTIAHDPYPCYRLLLIYFFFFSFRLIRRLETSRGRRFCKNSPLLPRERGPASASLAVAHTASGLPRFEPLAVNNARAELPARPCTYTCGVLRRLIKQQLHTVRAHNAFGFATYTHNTRRHTK